MPSMFVRQSTWIYSLNHQSPYEVVSMWVMELRPNQGMQLAKDHTANKKQSPDLIPGILWPAVLPPLCFFTSQSYKFQNLYKSTCYSQGPSISPFIVSQNTLEAERDVKLWSICITRLSNSPGFYYCCWDPFIYYCSPEPLQGALPKL